MNATTNNGIVKARPSCFNNVDPAAVNRREGWNPRFDFGDIEELAKSIRENGMLSPIRIKRTDVLGVFELIDGDRRLTAVEYLLKHKHEFPEGIPAIIESKDVSDIDLMVHMFEANSGKPFLPMEEAAAYKKLRDLGLTLKQVSERVGHAHVHIVDTLRLLEADVAVQEAVRSGKVNSTTAKQIAKAGKGDQKQLVEKAAAAKGKVQKRAVKKEIESKRSNVKASTRTKLKPLDVADLQVLDKEISLKLAQQLLEQDVKMTALPSFVSEDDARVMCFNYGVALGIRLALGHKVKVDL